MEISDFIRGVVPILLVEFLAAIAGTVYLRKVRDFRITKHLVVFLWITLFVEVISSYPAIAYFSEYKYFSFVENTPFSNNYWIYNIYNVGYYAFYIYYIRFFITNKIWRLVLKYLVYGYTILSILNLVFSDVYFNSIAQFATVSGTFLLFLSIVVFYFELLKSDVLLNLKGFIPLYISAGILVFNLSITPIAIFSQYFAPENPFYIQLRANIYLYGNIFLYSTFILGFIICQKEKSSY